MHEFKGVGIHWLGHDSFFIDASKKVYIDPFKIDASLKADIILITHSHYDHCSVADVEKILGEDTVIVCPPDCLSVLNHLRVKEFRIAEPNKSIDINGIKIETVPAYNISKQFHPKTNNWVGYIVNVDGVRIYHAGDTDLIDEMSKISCDIALLPVSGTYVMNADEAVEATRHIKAKVAIPMHYGSIIGSGADAKSFKERAKCEVIVLEKE